MVSAGAGRNALPCGVVGFLGDGKSVGLRSNDVVGRKQTRRNSSQISALKNKIRNNLFYP